MPRRSLREFLLAAKRTGLRQRHASRAQRLYRSLQRRSEQRGALLRIRRSLPPWNDERVHRYVFTVYAVDFPLLASQRQFQRQRCQRSHERSYPRICFHRRNLHAESEADQKFLIAQTRRAAFRGPSVLWTASLRNQSDLLQTFCFRESHDKIHGLHCLTGRTFY